MRPIPASVFVEVRSSDEPGLYSARHWIERLNEELLNGDGIAGLDIHTSRATIEAVRRAYTSAGYDVLVRDQIGNIFPEHQEKPGSGSRAFYVLITPA